MIPTEDLLCEISTKQMIVIRRDLKMRRGKEIAQGAHASLNSYLVAEANAGRMVMDHWFRTGQTKITLKVDNEETLVRMAAKAGSIGLPFYLVADEGRTEFRGVRTLTALAIGPYLSDVIDEVTAGYELY